jgi:hypothetical protein
MWLILDGSVPQAETCLKGALLYVPAHCHCPLLHLEVRCISGPAAEVSMLGA